MLFRKHFWLGFTVDSWRVWAITVGTLLCMSIFSCLAGCQITLTDNGTFGMRAGYDISFYHTTARTDSTTVAKVESQPLTDWLKRGAPQQTDATPTGSEAVPR